MYTIKKEIKVNDQLRLADLQYFEIEDIYIFQKLYKDWISLNKILKDLNSRTINIPEALTEGLCALFLNAPRVLNVNDSISSFD